MKLFKFLKKKCTICDNILNKSISCLICNKKVCCQCFINTYEGTVCSNCVTHPILNLERKRVKELNDKVYILKKRNKELEKLNYKIIAYKCFTCCECCDRPIVTQCNGIWSCFYCSNLNTTKWKHKDCLLNKNNII